MTETVTRLAGLDDVDLIAMHKRLDEFVTADAAIIEAHHLITTEMLKRDIPHGHVDDAWVDAVVLIEKAQVDGPDDVSAPAGMEKAWAKTLDQGGTVSVLLTTDGYVLKADPTVSDVHVDAIMGSGKKRPRRVVGPTEKESGFTIPTGVQTAAKRAAKWISEGKAGDGFTSVGRNRARQLADGGSVSRDVLVKMRAYFARHGEQRGDHDALNDGEPTPWRVAWDAWGGDAGQAWVNRVLTSVEKRAIPESITDIHINLENRQHAIDEYLYGPMNPDAPGDYWQRLADVWKVDAKEAKTTRCGNCAAFNQKPEILEAIADGISESGDAVADAADLGYCELFEFKCAAARSCSAWLTGGPLLKSFDKSQNRARETTATFTLPDGAVYEVLVPEGSVNGLEPISKHGSHDQKTHGRRYGASGRLNPEIAVSIIERVRATGGLSVSMVDGSEPPDGYMVARVGVKAAIVEADDFYDTPKGTAALASFLIDNKAELTGGDYLGVWHDTNGGKVYLDVSENVKDRETAIRLGSPSERNQISIWDVVEGKEIPTGGTGELEKAKAFRGCQIAGSVEDDGRGDRGLRERDLRETERSVVKHGEPGRDSDYHRKHPEGRSSSGSSEGKTYRTGDHKRAISMLARGEKVILESAEDANTFIEKLHDFATEARAKGEDSGNLDLCRVSVPGTNLFCGDSLGVKRADMPQLAGKPVAGSVADKMPKDKNGEVNVGELFREKLTDSGVDVRDTEMPAAKLKASQNELKGGNVAFMMSPEGQKEVDLEGTRIFVSSDGYVIDGHHRWAANIGLDANDGKLGDKKMKVTVIDMPISEVLQVANDFADDIGIAPKTAKSVMLKHQAGKHDQKSHGAWAGTNRRREAMTAGDTRRPLMKDAQGRVINPDATGGYKANIPESVKFKDETLTPDHSLWHHLESDNSGGYRFTKERAEVHREIVRSATEAVSPSANPTFYMLGGGPASGKTTAIESGLAGVPNRENAVQINADDIKEKFPEYDRMRFSDNDNDFFNAAAFSHEESSYVAKQVQKAAFENRQDVVLDGTGDSEYSKLERKIGQARDGGYKVIGVYATMPTEKSFELSNKRALGKDKRFVPETVLRETHKEISRVFPEATRRGLFDAARLIDTSDLGKAVVIGATDPSGRFQIYDESRWELFVQKGEV